MEGGFGGLFGDPEELSKRMAEFAEQMQAQQGLVWADTVLFESTGLNGHSSVRRVDLRTGRVLASRPLAAASRLLRASAAGPYRKPCNTVLTPQPTNSDFRA